jgi:hypothetical protein
MKSLNVQNEALNGRSFNEEVHDLVDSTVGPAKGLLVNGGGDGTDTVADAVSGKAHGGKKTHDK